MISAPRPDSERERLAALASYRVLDTDPETGFDDLTDLAADIVGTPIALVSLVDANRQWFKAHHGIDATETPRDIAFCAHAILQPEPFVVPDAQEDPRFADNPLVASPPFVRFYAGVPLVNPEGHALGTLCVIDHVPRMLSPTQLTALRKLGRQVVTQLELRRTRDHALRALAAKSEFLSTMSHEIRTPLNGVLGMTQLLLETPLSPEQREFAATVQACGDHLLAVINDVLDFSKLESGKVLIEQVPFDVGDLVRRTMEIFAPAARSKSLRLEARGLVSGDRRRLGDPTRVRQALLNLIGNAVKFTEAGGVTIEIAADDASADVTFSVTDTGIGIAECQIPSLFERFTQADSSTTRRFGGSGLGLAISRRIVELMGGALGIESQVGVGTRFWFRVPLPLAPVAKAADEGKAVGAADHRAPLPGEEIELPVRGMRVLVAEDNPVNQMLVKKLLARLQCEARIVDNGAAAVEAWSTAAFDAILMDCQMPEMDGYEATRRIRADGTDRSNVPIIALTASALESDRDQCMAAGMSDFLSKPLAAGQLEQALRRARTACH